MAEAPCKYIEKKGVNHGVQSTEDIRPPAGEGAKTRRAHERISERSADGLADHRKSGLG